MILATLTATFLRCLLQRCQRRRVQMEKGREWSLERRRVRRWAECAWVIYRQRHSEQSKWSVHTLSEGEGYLGLD